MSTAKAALGYSVFVTKRPGLNREPQLPRHPCSWPRRGPANEIRVAGVGLWAKLP
jgi:hypothetical protein